jgi:uncharacterized protein (DUF58 family)
MSQTSQQFTDPAFFAKLDNMELRARGIVEGFMQGLHRSPFVGFSVEFNTHREYCPGDDLRHVNWKLYARQKRLYVKEYDAETNMNLYIMLDVSNSMTCASTGVSKLDYAASLAAALSHLALKQRDAVGLMLFGDNVESCLTPRANLHQLNEILRAIANTSAQPATESGKALQQCAELARHRGICVVISDLYDDTETLMSAIEQMRFRNHEVVVFHIMDRFERDLPLEGNVRFHDLETNVELTTHADGIRDQYCQAVTEWRKELESELLNRSVDRVELVTDEPLDQALLDYLVVRTKAG